VTSRNKPLPANKNPARRRISSADIPRGFAYSSVACGLKKSGLDLGLMISEVPATAAAVFTTNRVKAAPVVTSQLHLKKSRTEMRGVIVNSGNANCCTGSEGFTAATATTLKVAKELGKLRPTQILVCSTGVIGVPLRWQKIVNAIPKLVRGRGGRATSFAAFTRAIMTTDSRPKSAAAKFSAGGKEIRILGCTKGAGMIQPNMATMLAFLATDAAVSPPLLARALKTVVDRTFNAITVDGDTSTNDTVTLLANGESSARKITREDTVYTNFCSALEQVCKSLAFQIVADGEGAQRVIEIEVRGAPSDRAADRVARTVANSPLVKTAFAGADPNWGRIIAAAGRSGVPFDSAEVDISLAGISVCRRGREHPFDERAAHHKMLASFVPVIVNLNSGKGLARVWTCDFTTEYIHINASYRT
jgi:glutamate N-acetyltransferase / amino-acid N-acetyltransferase